MFQQDQSLDNSYVINCQNSIKYLSIKINRLKLNEVKSRVVPGTQDKIII
jgi:hypothetical protein